MARFKFVRRHWALWIALAVYIFIIAQTLSDIMTANEGHFVYPLDDTYIHMAIAKNFVQHGVWGITRYHFTSSSSSILWTLLIAAGDFVFGIRTALPLILNLIIGTGFVTLLYAVLRRWQVPALYTLAAMVLIMLYMPISTFAVLGMEHLLHTTLSIAFVFLTAYYLENTFHHRDTENTEENKKSFLGELGVSVVQKEFILLCLLGAAVTATRYEGLFVLVAVCALFVLRLRVVQALIIGVIGALPIIIYGLISVAQGWTFLPVTLLLKSGGIQNEMGNPTRFLSEYIPTTYAGLQHLPILGALLIGVTLLFVIQYARRRTLSDSRLLLLIACAIVLLLYARFVWDPGQFYRYSAHIVVLTLVCAAASCADMLPHRPRLSDLPLYAAILLVVPLLIGNFWTRYLDLTQWQTPVAASRNIYQQQYQMGRFLHTYYDDAVVLAQDIGAVSYFTDADVVDIWGLGTLEVAQARLDGSYTLERLDQLVSDTGATVAIVYDSWVAPTFGQIPPTWVAVGTWTIDSPVVVLGTTVTFYALTPEAVAPLIANLQAFKDTLPHTVYQQGRYVDELAAPG